MDIKIEERSIGRVTILDIVGKLTVDQGARASQRQDQQSHLAGAYLHHLESRERAVHRQRRPWPAGGLVRIGHEDRWGDETSEHQFAESRPALHYASGDAVRVVRLRDLKRCRAFRRSRLRPDARSDRYKYQGQGASTTERALMISLFLPLYCPLPLDPCLPASAFARSASARLAVALAEAVSRKGRRVSVQDSSAIVGVTVPSHVKR